MTDLHYYLIEQISDKCKLPLQKGPPIPPNQPFVSYFTILANVCELNPPDKVEYEVFE
jgi:hypothetical protein